MPYFCFFEFDGSCAWMRKQIEETYEKYLRGPIDYQGRKVRFYAVLSWVMENGHGANPRWVEKSGYSIVRSLADLPDGAGVLVTGYDADAEELTALRRKGTPIIDKPCPWIRRLKETLERDDEKRQRVLMIDTEHMVHRCFRSIYPRGTIVVDMDDYADRLARERDGRPLALAAYATFRPADVEAVAAYISKTYPHPDNETAKAADTLCMWTGQGILEEITRRVEDERLDEVWIVCSSAKDRSTKSLIRQVRDAGAEPLLIDAEDAIPSTTDSGKRIGVLCAPIPLDRERTAIKERLRR